MKTKLLFITQYLQTGGVEKSLLSLLSSLDYEKYDVDLLLFDYSGVLFHSIPKEVRVLPPLFKGFSVPLRQLVIPMLKSGDVRLLTGKALASTLSKFTKGVGTGVRWSVYRYTLERLKQHYDVAISYLDFFCNYYAIEKVNADKKILYNHMDYSYSLENGWQCPKYDRRSFVKSDYIVTVAETSKKSLIQFFPEVSTKIHVIHNSVSPQVIRTMADNESAFEFDSKGNIFNIVTVARLVEEKGLLLALESCKKLIDKGLPIKWYIIGAGSLYGVLNKKIKQLDLQQRFILLGEKSNPYPYIKQCDLYVQPSKTEAHCVAVEEAMTLQRPIIVTNIPSFRQQVKDGETGIIVDGSSEGLTSGIEYLYKSVELRKKLVANLQKLPERHKEELEKLYQLIEK